MDTQGAQLKEKDDDKKTLEVIVYSPRNPSDRRDFSFEKTAKVGEAAASAAAQFGYSGGQPTFAKNGDPLDREKPLVAEKVRDGDVLEIVDSGGGV